LKSDFANVEMRASFFYTTKINSDEHEPLECRVRET
jgi:hypothetical protein